MAKMAMTPIERKAAFRAAATLQEVTMANAARRLGVSYNHLMLVLNGDRKGSDALKSRIAGFLGCATVEVFDRER
jgi:transcriptional regulator with XRE-family HTH domain